MAKDFPAHYTECNLQTMAGLNEKVFEDKGGPGAAPAAGGGGGGEGPKAPAAGGIAGKHANFCMFCLNPLVSFKK